jgi:heme-degrading monooxygenase HmoA
MLPELQTLNGFKALYLLRRDLEGETEFVVITLWNSLDSIRVFAGDDSEKAVIDPEGAQHLLRYELRTKHYDILLAP